MPEDEGKEGDAKIQTMTDNFSSKVDKYLESKEKEIMTVQLNNKLKSKGTLRKYLRRFLLRDKTKKCASFFTINIPKYYAQTLFPSEQFLQISISFLDFKTEARKRL